MRVSPPRQPAPPRRRPGERLVAACGRSCSAPSAAFAQNKLEMLQRSMEARAEGSTTTCARTAETSLLVEATREPLLAPPLLRPALLTEDMIMQRDMALASVPDEEERAELLAEFNARELRSDMAAFRAANPSAALADFVRWRSEVERLDSEPFLRTWLQRVWLETTAQPASEQSLVLFEPEREAEMALHYLENIDGTQLLLQLFRVLLSTTLQELGVAVSAGPPHLRVLHRRAVSAALAAFTAPRVPDVAADSSETPAGPEDVGTRTDDECAVAACEGGADQSSVDKGSAAKPTEVHADVCIGGEEAAFPTEKLLSAVIAAVEELEEGQRLLASLEAKLPEAFLEDLLCNGEVTVSSHTHRKVVEELFAKSKRLAQEQGREDFDGKGIFESVPLAKEFVLLLQPAGAASACATGGAPGAPAAAPTAPPALAAYGGGTKRLYAEIRDNQLRIALSREFRMA